MMKAILILALLLVVLLLLVGLVGSIVYLIPDFLDAWDEVKERLKAREECGGK